MCVSAFDNLKFLVAFYEWIFQILFTTYFIVLWLQCPELFIETVCESCQRKWGRKGQDKCLSRPSLLLCRMFCYWHKGQGDEKNPHIIMSHRSHWPIKTLLVIAGKWSWVSHCRRINIVDNDLSLKQEWLASGSQLKVYCRMEEIVEQATWVRKKINEKVEVKPPAEVAHPVTMPSLKPEGLWECCATLVNSNSDWMQGPLKTCLDFTPSC